MSLRASEKTKKKKKKNAHHMQPTHSTGPCGECVNRYLGYLDWRGKREKDAPSASLSTPIMLGRFKTNPFQFTYKAPAPSCLVTPPPNYAVKGTSPAPHAILFFTSKDGSKSLLVVVVVVVRRLRGVAALRAALGVNLVAGGLEKNVLCGLSW